MPTTDQKTEQTRPRRPSTLFLISLNALLFLGIWGVGANIFGQVLAAIVTIAYVALCGIWHASILLAEKHYYFNPLVRSLLFLAPLLLILILPIIGIAPTPVANQVTPLVSPSERYQLQVRAHRFWDLRFLDLETTEDQIEETEFAGHYPIYWQWDEDDRLWVFNGENWQIYFWKKTDEGWERSTFRPEEHPELSPPEAIFPEYVSR